MTTPILFTDRLKLRQFTKDDAQEIYDCWMSDPEVSKYMMWEASDDYSKLLEFLDYELQAIEDDNWFRWAITDKDTGVIYGTCLIFYNDETDCWDISYNLGKNFWGRGYITEAMKKAMNYIINYRGIQEFATEYAVDNPASGNVIQKLGFVYEKDTEYVCGNGYRTTGKRYVLKAKHPDYSKIIGSTVKGVIDRPLGSLHPSHQDIRYQVNYGYVTGVYAQDGEEQDVYYLGTDKPVDAFEGRVVAVYHRLNDVEDKWIVVPSGNLSDADILEQIDFQERYFVGKLYR